MTAYRCVTRLITYLRKLEDAVLVALLIAMILLAVYQIILRNFYDSGLIWGESLLRVLVLWVGLMGAMIASRKGNHININLITHLVRPRIQAAINILTSLFTAAICALLAYHSFRFVLIEYQDGLTAFANVPTWVCELIIPVAFCLISFRYLALGCKAILKTEKNEPLTHSGNSTQDDFR